MMLRKRPLNFSSRHRKLTHQRMLAQLVQCDLAMNKSYLCCAMNIAEQKQYEELYKEIEKGIVSTQHKIEETKMELQQARQIRRNKMEYDALAAIIQTQPDRKTNQERLAQLRSDLQASELECDKLEAKLALRRKQFHLLISSIQGLQQLLTEEEN